MKKVFFIAFAFISFSVCSQRSIAFRNGCSDGTRAANVGGDSKLAPLNSILANPGLTLEYKDDYQEGFRTCLQTEQQGKYLGNKVIKSPDFDFKKKPEGGRFPTKK